MYREHSEASHLGETPYLLEPGQTPDRGIGYNTWGKKLGDLGNPGAFSLTKFCEAIGPGSSTGCVQAPSRQDAVVERVSLVPHIMAWLHQIARFFRHGQILFAP